MTEIVVEKLNSKVSIPYHLLLLADPSKKLVDEYLEQGFCYIAKIENKIIGAYVLIQIQPNVIEIINIAVHKDFQGKGIGKWLVLDAIEKAKSLQALTIEIGTGNSSIQQLALYQKCGFRITGIDRDFFVSNYDEEIYENGIRCRDMIRLSLEL